MNVDELELTKIINLVTEITGIVPRDSHITGIKNWIEKRKVELEVENYYDFLKTDNEEFLNLINGSTVNETYFFREQSQFEFLHDTILPELRLKYPLEKIRIWSAASSTGEEVYSLYLLAKSLGIRTECTATDINTKVLNVLKEGKFKKNSAKLVDGAEFAYLLEPFKQEDGSFVFPQEICSSINSRQINLSSIENPPKNQHLIFLRNVFIYFTPEMKKKILEVIAQECLIDGGYLFVSMNEVASLDFNILPKCFQKQCGGNNNRIFYFQKKGELNG